MPVIPYYCGRPASTWTAAGSGSSRAAAADLAAVTSPASPRPAAPAVPRRMPEETSVPAATAARIGPWETWAGNWFRPLTPSGKDAPRAG
jgi:hypothetical protein